MYELIIEKHSERVLFLFLYLSMKIIIGKKDNM